MQHARGKGNSAIVNMLVEAGAKEAVHTPCRGVVRSFAAGGTEMYRREGGAGADGNPGADGWALLERGRSADLAGS